LAPRGDAKAKVVEAKAVFVEAVIGEGVVGWALETEQEGPAGETANPIIAGEGFEIEDFFVKSG
jgi:hypothetical protein